MQVFGNEKTHDMNLHKAMECTRKAGIKLNFDVSLRPNVAVFW